MDQPPAMRAAEAGPPEGSGVWPDGVWLPDSGSQRGTLGLCNGDCLTPLRPAKNYTYRSLSVTGAQEAEKLPK